MNDAKKKALEENQGSILEGIKRCDKQLLQKIFTEHYLKCMQDDTLPEYLLSCIRDDSKLFEDIITLFDDSKPLRHISNQVKDSFWKFSGHVESKAHLCSDSGVDFTDTTGDMKLAESSTQPHDYDHTKLAMSTSVTPIQEKTTCKDLTTDEVEIELQQDEKDLEVAIETSLKYLKKRNEYKKKCRIYKRRATELVDTITEREREHLEMKDQLTCLKQQVNDLNKENETLKEDTKRLNKEKGQIRGECLRLHQMVESRGVAHDKIIKGLKDEIREQEKIIHARTANEVDKK